MFYGSVVDPSYKNGSSLTRFEKVPKVRSCRDVFVCDVQEKLRPLQSTSVLTSSEIVDRIIKNRFDFEERNRKKEEKEVVESGKSHTK